MTDGEDTVSKPSAINCAKEYLQAEMGKYGADIPEACFVFKNS